MEQADGILSCSNDLEVIMTQVQCPSCGAAVEVPEQKKSKAPWVIGCLVVAFLGLMGLAVLGVLAGLIIPAISTARERAMEVSCEHNLMMIESGKELWAMENDKPEGSPVNQPAVNELMGEGFDPLCPEQGEYKYNPVGKLPECSVHGALPAHEF